MKNPPKVLSLAREKYPIDFLSKFNSIEETINYFIDFLEKRDGRMIFSSDTNYKICGEIKQCLYDICETDDLVLEDYFIRVGFIEPLRFEFSIQEDINNFVKLVMRELKLNYANFIAEKNRRDSQRNKAYCNSLYEEGYLSRIINKKYHIAQMYDESYEEFKQRFNKLIKENNITDLSEISINCGLGIPVQFSKGG